MKPAKIQGTKGIPEYWNFYCGLKIHEGWVKNESSVHLKQFIKKGDSVITYEQFSELLKSYFKEASLYVIKGYRLRFDFGLGNLRIIRYQGREADLRLYKNTDNIDRSVPQCAFYFHRDSIDSYKRKRELGTEIENIKNFDLFIARSDGTNDKSLGLKFKLSHMIKKNPDLVYIYDVKKFDRDI